MMKEIPSHGSKLLVLCCCFLTTICFAQQKTVETENQVWFAYFNQMRLSEKWGIWTDLHLRTKEDFVHDFSIGIVRVGLMYYLRDQTRITAGYGYINHFPSPGHANISRPEHRPWQQIQWFTNYPKLRMMQYLRLEERYRRKVLNDDALAEDYLFNFRVRYNFLLQLPLSKQAFQPGTFSAVMNDELHLNFGKEIVNNTFDQNRISVGLNYHLSARDNVQLGYMHVFAQLPSGMDYRSLHIVRLFYIHSLDLRPT